MASSPFWRPIDMSRTALLLSDVQSQLIAHMPEDERTSYLSDVGRVLQHFRTQIADRRASRPFSALAPNDGIPLIIHHVVPFGINSNAFISPYNKLNTWAVQRMNAGAKLLPSSADPNMPLYAIPGTVKPPNGWSADEVLLSKIAPGCFMNSDLLTYLRARDIRHVVIVGLTTEGSVLSSVREASDLDFHAIVPEDACWADEREVHEFVMRRLLPRFADVVRVADVELLV
jgi:nicotinamidase-related amidase